MSALIHTMIGKHHLKPDMPGEFFEQSVTKMLDHYKQQNGCHNIEYRMHHTDLCLGDISMRPCRIHNTQICNRNNTENDRSDDIKDQMHQRCGFRIFLCTHTGQNCSYAGTDILSHDNIDCCAKRYKTLLLQGSAGFRPMQMSSG